jgi:hypothetical protein
MPLTPPIRIRQSDEAIWIEDAGAARCCFTYFDRDDAMRAVRQRWRYEEAVAIVRAAARALSTGEPPPPEDHGDRTS